MTVSSNSRKAGPFAGNGVTTSFPFTFKVFTKDDLQVTRTVVATGVQDVLVLDSDYSVTLNVDQDNNPGGSIEYPVAGAVLTATHTLSMLSDLPYTQETDISNAGSFLPQVIEDVFDRIVMLVQQVLEVTSRAIRFPVGDPSNAVLPSAVDRAGKAIVFDADGLMVMSVDFTVLAEQALQSAQDALVSANEAAASFAAAQALVSGAVVHEQHFTGPGPWVMTAPVVGVMQVYVNGLKQRVGSFSVVGLTVTNTSGQFIPAQAMVDIQYI